MRGPLLISLSGGAALAFVPQALEIYRTLVLDSGLKLGLLVVTAFTLLVLIVGLWALCWTLIGDEPRSVRHASTAVCAVLPAAGMAVGLWRAGLEVTPIGMGQPPGAVDTSVVAALAQTSALRETLRIWAPAVGAGGIVAVILLAAVASRLIPARLGLRWVALPIALIGLALGIVFDIDPNHAPRLVGSLGIFLLFMLVVAAVVTSLLQIRDRFGVPALSLFLFLAVVFSWLNISDNHIPPLVERAKNATSKEPLVVVPTVVALQSWLNGRGDKTYFEERNQPYPIFVISAEGGGQYAAYLTAIFLARAQDRCPNFAQHVFAISSVSGGSIGAGIFSALSKEFAQNTAWQGCKLGDLGTGPFEVKAHAILDRDFLSPVVAAALFGAAIAPELSI